MWWHRSIMMTKRFLEFMPFIWKWEGGYTNDPDDPGGETKFGIDKRSHPGEDIKALTKERALEIYWRDYWVRNGCDALAYPFGEVFFNACVNCGPWRARRLAARAREAAGFVGEQEAFYRRLAAGKPELGKFLKGWLNRCGDLRARLGLEK